jgi:IclR family KDG regulon transcriptional repressor
MFRLSAVVMADMNLRRAALPFVEDLCNEVSETISLNIIEGTDRVCIEVVDSSEVIRNIVKVGQRNNLCVGSSGWLMLSYLPATERENIFAESIKRWGCSL